MILAVSRHLDQTICEIIANISVSTESDRSNCFIGLVCYQYPWPTITTPTSVGAARGYQRVRATKTVSLIDECGGHNSTLQCFTKYSSVGMKKGLQSRLMPSKLHQLHCITSMTKVVDFQSTLANAFKYLHTIQKV